MSTTQLTRKEILKKGFVLNAVKFLKEIHYICKDGYNDLNVAMFSKKYNVPPDTVPAMVKLGILTRNNNLKNAKFYWNKDFYPIESLASSIYEKITSDKRIYYANKRLEDQSKRGKKLIPIIGTKRVSKDQAINILKEDQLLNIMRAIYESTKEGTLQSSESIINIIKSLHFKNSDSLLKALVDGKYLVARQFGQVGLLILYTWKEQEPNHEHAVFIKDLMEEQNSELQEDETITQPDPKKVERVFNLLNDLHQIKEFTQFRMRDKIIKFGLNKSDQVVICGQVLDQEGPKNNRSYKWKQGVEPTMELATELLLKSRLYTKSLNFGGLDTDKTNVDPPHIKMDEPAPSYTNMESARDTSIQDLIQSMEAEKLKLLDRLNYLDTKISEGKGILELKEKEIKFIKSLSPVIKDDQTSQMDKVTKNHEQFISNKTMDVNAKEKFDALGQKQSKDKNQRHKHTRDEILKLLSNTKVITTNDLIEHFYPGQTHKDDSVKALMSMMYALKTKKLIINSNPGVYKAID